MTRRRFNNKDRGPLIEVVEELKTSGNWTVPSGCKSVDIFIVGGGGSGASSGPERGGGGGGSGYAKIYLDVPVSPGSTVQYVVGVGGDRVTSMSAYSDYKDGKAGGDSWFISSKYIGRAGSGGRYTGKGGDGGSGGGTGRLEEGPSGYNGGSDGSNGYGDMPGVGQGSTTKCPFNNKLYAGGGGGGGYRTGSAAGGGGVGDVGDVERRPTDGKVNTGSGGGSYYISGSNVSGGSYSGAGGSGIIVLRYKKYER